MKRDCPRRTRCPNSSAVDLRRFAIDEGFASEAVSLSTISVLGHLSNLDHAVSVTRNTAASMTTLGIYAVPQRSGTKFDVEPRRMCLRFDPEMLGPTLLSKSVAPVRKPVSLHFLDQQNLVIHESFLTNVDDGADLENLSLPQIEPSAELVAKAKVADWKWQPKHIASTSGHYADAGNHVDSILTDNGIARRASLPAWGENLTWQIDINDLVRLFSLLKEAWMPLGISVGNAGLVQYHQGTIDGVKRSGNVLRISSRPSEVTLLLDELEEAWITRIEVGTRTQHMLELYDWRYHCVAQFTDSDDSDENLSIFWRQILGTLTRLDAVT